MGGAVRLADMLYLLGGRWRRPLSTLRLRARLPALPLCAAAAGSAAVPGGWYEALAGSAPVRAAEAALLGAQAASGLPWWACIALTTACLRGALTLPLAALQHRVLAQVSGAAETGGAAAPAAARETPAARPWASGDQRRPEKPPLCCTV